MDEERRVYFRLHEIIDFMGFHFSTESFRRQEKEILQPQLEDLGYTDIEWLPGEGQEDSFGPLTRICHAKDYHGDDIWFVYG